MVYFPSVNAVKASFDPNNTRKDASKFWINSSNDKSLTQAAEQELKKAAGAVSQKPAGVALYSPEFFGLCALGGALSCGLTHAAVTPLDLVKCRRQVDASLYTSNIQGWKTIVKTEGLGGIFTGFNATLIGYFFQGMGKFGLYEMAKWKTAEWAGEENAVKYKTPLFLVSSAAAEFVADILLCPWEAVKVKTQTTLPPYATSAFDGMKKIVAAEGVNGLYKGLTPLWARQIPYTMVKFATFENTVAAIYSQLPYAKEQYSKVAQTGVSFAAGYFAVVSKINAERQAGESMGACMSRIYARIGFMGLWNGLPVRIVMVGTLTGLQWLFYDSFKAFMGIPTAGGAPAKK